jgi:hypothetical protein
VRGIVRISIEKAFALRASEKRVGSFRVRQVAGVRPKIELGQIPLQMGFTQTVEGPDHAAVEQREVQLGRVRRLGLARHLEIDPEAAFRRELKFERHFSHIEEHRLANVDESPRAVVDEMEALLVEAKELERRDR